MNKIETIDTEYIRPNRTIETVLLKRNQSNKLVWVYNYKGIHYRVFENLIDVLHFFNNSFEPKYSFENEIELDNFLMKYNLSNSHLY